MSELGTGYIVKFKLETNKEGLDINNVDFSIDFYTRKKLKLNFAKSELVKQDGWYIVCLDSSLLKLGDLKATVYIEDPELIWKNHRRPVILERYTGIVLGECECTAEPEEDECHCFDQGYKIIFESTNLVGVPDPEEEDLPQLLQHAIYYGKIVDHIQSFNDFTEAMLTNPSNNFSFIDNAVKESLEIVNLNQGDKIVVLIPEGANYEARKDDGTGNKIVFNESILGSNGQYTVVINDIRYKIYGEFVLASANTYIYIV